MTSTALRAIALDIYNMFLFSNSKNHDKLENVLLDKKGFCDEVLDCHNIVKKRISSKEIYNYDDFISLGYKGSRKSIRKQKKEHNGLCKYIFDKDEKPSNGIVLFSDNECKYITNIVSAILNNDKIYNILNNSKVVSMPDRFETQLQILCILLNFKKHCNYGTIISPINSNLLISENGESHNMNWSIISKNKPNLIFKPIVFSIDFPTGI